jgi:hypothetical protein
VNVDAVYKTFVWCLDVELWRCAFWVFEGNAIFVFAAIFFVKPLKPFLRSLFLWWPLHIYTSMVSLYDCSTCARCCRPMVVCGMPVWHLLIFLSISSRRFSDCISTHRAVKIISSTCAWSLYAVLACSMCAQSVVAVGVVMKEKNIKIADIAQWGRWPIPDSRLLNCLSIDV